ncbi:MAG: helix-turn-helix transcriptional regulator [Candidatus Omnitrophica bacterium]|nr:helix-turn-helix transcriptional regulator [Candidatus Omnitrophota bacterium]
MIHSINRGPFGQVLYLWRLERGLTQEELARRARIPRPNLSAIERGKREVTLKTLRALAVALNVRPGILADGAFPASEKKPPSFSRQALERIADAVVRGRVLHSKKECALVDLIRGVVGHRLPNSKGSFEQVHHGKRFVERAWLLLESKCPPAVLKSLLQRVADRELSE